ncbi:MAG: TonB-dependent receptor domain-containing protein [Henriciella sp.]
MNRTNLFHSVLLSGACLMALQPLHAQESDPVETAEEPEESRTLETVQVRGRFIPQEVRTTSEVANLIDSADFALQGDGDAAAALSRVAGIATSQDNFVYLRGLNERYSTALLNGSPLPSPAPLRRVAPLDLFPTSALKSILVQKTYSPDLPAEFGGGLVDIRTKSIPDSGFFEVSIGGAINTAGTFETGLLYDGSDTDIFGFDDGARDIPSLANGLSADFGRELSDNSSLLVLQSGDVPGDFSFGATGGNIYDLNENIAVGVIASVGYSNEWVTKEGRRGNAFLAGPDELGAFDDFERFSTENNIGIDAFGSVGFNLYDDHEIAFNGLITRSSEKEARTNIGVNDTDEPRRVDALEWIERELWTGQVTGEHFFESLMGLEVNWRGSYSEASRDAPYQLTTIYVLDDNLRNPRLLSTQDANQFQFSEIADDTTDFGIDLALPLESASGDCFFFCEVELKAGYSYVENDREATARTFGLVGIAGAPQDDLRLDFLYNFIFNNTDANGNILGGVRQVSDIVQPSKYIATLEVDAAYVGIDAQVTPYIRAAIGGRFEDAIQAIAVGGFNEDLSMGPVDGLIEEEDFLPAATLTWNPIDDVQVRFGYSQTITRPQFRELASAIFVNSETDVTFIGNPFLVNAEIDNFDARFEYYYSADQFLTLGVFYKDMINPIEEVIVPTENIQTTFLNAPAAILYGAEFEFESPLNLQDWFGWDFLGDGEVIVKTNYTWSESEVDADGEVAINIGTPLAPVRGTTNAAGRIEDGRRLQGQSEHLFNLQLIYSDLGTGVDANVLFNFASERIRTAETLARNLPAIIEQPPATVDFVLSKRFELREGEYDFSFKIQNLFGEGYEAYQELGSTRIEVDTYDIGTVFSIGLKRSF